MQKSYPNHCNSALYEGCKQIVKIMLDEVGCRVNTNQPSIERCQAVPS